MDYKKTNAPATTVTRDMMELCADTGNVYETVAIIGKKNFSNLFSDEEFDSQVVSGMIIPAPYCLAIIV